MSDKPFVLLIIFEKAFVMDNRFVMVDGCVLRDENSANKS